MITTFVVPGSPFGVPGVRIPGLVLWLCLLTASVATSLSAPLAAHHSGTMFEEKKTVTLEGVVKEFQYTNPHSWLLVDVTSKDGTVTTWGFEAEGPSTLARAGIKPSDFAPGTRISITGRPMKDGRPAATWEFAVRTKDKKRFEPREGFRVK